MKILHFKNIGYLLGIALKEDIGLYIIERRTTVLFWKWEEIVAVLCYFQNSRTDSQEIYLHVSGFEFGIQTPLFCWKI
jgi:hypothetical protein